MSDATLTAWQQYSLIQRVWLFKEAFPDVKLNHMALRALYRKHGIIWRVIKPGILLSARQQKTQFDGRQAAFTECIRLYNEQRDKLLFVDEAVYSSTQACRKVWGNKTVATLAKPRNRLSFPAVAVVAALNVKGEIVQTLCREKSID